MEEVKKTLLIENAIVKIFRDGFTIDEGFSITITTQTEGKKIEMCFNETYDSLLKNGKLLIEMIKREEINYLNYDHYTEYDLVHHVIKILLNSKLGKSLRINPLFPKESFLLGFSKDDVYFIDYETFEEGEFEKEEFIKDWVSNGKPGYKVVQEIK